MAQTVKHLSVCNAGAPGSIPGLGRSPGEGNGSPLQYSHLENSMDSEAWYATFHGVAKSQARLSDFTKLTKSSSRIHYCYIILRNVEGKKFVLFSSSADPSGENCRPLSPWGPPDFLSTCLGTDCLSCKESDMTEAT